MSTPSNNLPSGKPGELLQRYLQAVRFWLPKSQQEDILAELSEDLRSQVEDKETELGRRLDETELGAILKKCGNPMRVASRYQPGQYLIGPTWFPVYRFVLKLVLFWGSDSGFRRDRWAGNRAQQSGSRRRHSPDSREPLDGRDHRGRCDYPDLRDSGAGAGEMRCG
jgi:hypothetical protein